ncbi:hypothetical protein DFP72DRAFT_849729 [Ephemerocybe angulata]|uniref:Uncharacterized protein n=1 Tax=Ephemerocybe angulata TaxID=980116 RepID=A0A8H6HTZ6_9AGAR|nr:hypothetical protein DFP72DRAFT_849729 [Tulosesus angulatus]
MACKSKSVANPPSGKRAACSLRITSQGDDLHPNNGSAGRREATLIWMWIASVLQEPAGRAWRARVRIFRLDSEILTTEVAMVDLCSALPSTSGTGQLVDHEVLRPEMPSWTSRCGVDACFFQTDQLDFIERPRATYDQNVLIPSYLLNPVSPNCTSLMGIPDEREYLEPSPSAAPGPWERRWMRDYYGSDGGSRDASPFVPTHLYMTTEAAGVYFSLVVMLKGSKCYIHGTYEAMFDYEVPVCLLAASFKAPYNGPSFVRRVLRWPHLLSNDHIHKRYAQEEVTLVCDTPGNGLASEHCPAVAQPTTIEALLASLSVLTEDEMTAIVYHASEALFANGKERVEDYKHFFFQVGSDWQASRLHQSVEVWQTALFAGLLLLQRYYSINLLRGHKSTSYNLLSEYRIDAVVFAAAIMALQHGIVDEHYSSPALDVEMGYPKGTHESCKIALLRGLEWNLNINAADLAKFTQDVTWAWPNGLALLYILKRSPFGQYGGPRQDDMFLDGGIIPPTAEF